MAIGLDCADPRQSWDRLAHACPNLLRLRARSEWGPLRSTTPPITVPAWSSMMSGCSPGELGLYGLRARMPGSYGMRVATAQDVRAQRVWDVLDRIGRRVVLVGVPQTYPPPRLERGEVVACFLTPSPDSVFTQPAKLKAELEKRFGPYRIDAEGFRTNDRELVLGELYAMTEQRFAIARHLARTRDWDFLMVVDMGLDRFHHAFWASFNPDHPAFDPQDPWSSEAERYYRFVDSRLGELVALADDQTAVLVVSDHGARTLRGGVCVNDLLRRAGFLTLKSEPRSIVNLERADVDWRRTAAWAEGGYYARVFLNVKGRELEGAIELSESEGIREQVARLMCNLVDEAGRPMQTRALRPRELYSRCDGNPPDLMVFLDDLGRRAIGSVGHDSILVATNDTGSDGCNHDWHGIFQLATPWAQELGPIGEVAIESVGRKVLDLLDVAESDRPPGLRRPSAPRRV